MNDLNKRLGYTALISALFISSIAIYFSVAGLAAIFSAYAISIIVMGTAIEIGKLVAVAWLHYNWHDKLWLRSGLLFLVAGTMFITSMGIFGYLSKSHVEQTAASQESVEQVKRINNEIGRLNAIIVRSGQKITGYESNGSGVDASLNAQIDKEQRRIDSAYDRVKPVIQVQLQIIKDGQTNSDGRTAPYKKELTEINKTLTELQTALSNKQIRIAQGIVGTRPDGSYREKTQAAIKDFRTRKEARRDVLLKKIDGILGKPTVAQSEAQAEIKRIRASVQEEINESNATIKRLRSRMGKTNANDIETLITDERTKIKESNVELDTLTQEKYTREAGVRKLEAEVGPIKYIAEFVYDTEADANLLEKAVQWLIILIIFVFDPFAILLLIAAQHSFDKVRATRKEDEVHDGIPTLAKYVEQPITSNESVVDAPIPEFTAGDGGVYQPVHGELDDNDPPREDGDSIDFEEEEPWEDLNELSDIAKDLQIEQYAGDGPISLTRVNDEYINFNGKVFQTTALIQAFPKLRFDFNKQIKSGIVFPVTNIAVGEMFLRTDSEPTQLYIFNGVEWDRIDKNILNFNAYSHEYIKVLIKRVGNSDYNPELLNEAEKKHIEDLLGRE